MEEGRNTRNDDYARSHPHDGDNTTEASDIGVYGDTERENGDSRIPTTEKPADEAVFGKSFLEPQLLCHDNRVG